MISEAHREWPQFSNWLETCQTFLFITEGDPELTEIANKLLFSGEELTALSEPLARNILNHGEWPFFSSILLRAQLFLIMAEVTIFMFLKNCGQAFEASRNFINSLRANVTIFQNLLRKRVILR